MSLSSHDESVAKLVPFYKEANIILRYIFKLIRLYYLNTNEFEKLNFSKRNSKDEEKYATTLDKANAAEIYLQIRSIFSDFRKELQIDKYDKTFRGLNNHFKDGVNESEFDPRLLKLILISCRKANLMFEKNRSADAQFAPSPLNILYNFLTIPQELQSSAFSLYACRSILFAELNTFPYHQNSNFKNNSLDEETAKLFKEEDVLDSISMFKNYIQHRDNVPARENNPAHLICANFLAMRGLFFLRFKNERERISFFESDSLKGTSKINKQKIDYEFRLSKEYSDILSAEELINNIWGVPIPIKGLDTLFFGGIKKDTKESIVVSMSGQAGIGKTSLALAIAANFSPLGTKCFYITLEENPSDLRLRLISLIPDYLKKLSIYREDVDSWFYPRNYELTADSNIKTLTAFLAEIKEILFQQNDRITGNFTPICPLIIVIDSINGLISKEEGISDKNLYDQLENFVQSCRELKSFVLLVSGEDLPKLVKLDYLVDVVIDLKHVKTNELSDKPMRVFKLLKTRHQVSRPGSHLFHISGHKGLRISPQIPSQMDKKILLKRNLPDKNNVIHTFNLIGKTTDIRNSRQLSLYNYSEKDWNKTIKIFDKSQILIHGHGSSGKAGLALKILLTPPLKTNVNPFDSSLDLSTYEFKRKVLIISFLYPEDYYYDLIEKRINPFFKSIYDYPPINPVVEPLTFYPGFLNSEDFAIRVSYALDEAILRGEPFTGVLLDGLHNVFLQFPNIQNHNMVWPMLYSLLNRYNLTVVSTFTNFQTNSGQNVTNSQELFSDDYEDRLLMQKGQKPFLHALVQSSDFYFKIEPKPTGTTTKYLLLIESAFDQAFKKGPTLFWQREDLILYTE